MCHVSTQTLDRHKAEADVPLDGEVHFLGVWKFGARSTFRSR